MGSIMEYSYYNIILWKKNSKYRRYPKNFLSIDIFELDFDYLLFLKFENQHPYQIPDLDILIEALESIHRQNRNCLTVLTNMKAPPLFTASEDEFVYSFCCEVSDFKILISNLEMDALNSTTLLFEVLDNVICGKSTVNKILIREIPIKIDIIQPQNLCDVIIPHLGDNTYLKNLLHFLEQISGIKVSVGIDQEISPVIFELKELNENVSFYYFEPNPIGPYVIRNRLIDESHENFIFFQDSDDIPCFDRFDRIIQYMKKDNCELCGSHELRIDYYTRTVQAVRFPIDVKAALRVGPWHSLLHPASSINREAFYKCFKLSEERTFGNDTKFLLFSYFFLHSIKNIGEFLYIRRKRPNSLTTSPETMIDSPIRNAWLNAWNYDFEDVKRGSIRLNHSSIFPLGTGLNVKYGRL